MYIDSQPRPIFRRHTSKFQA